MEQKEKSELSAEMDAALELAKQDLPKLKTAQDVADWLKKWYMKAGYKRLNRALMAQFPSKK